MGERTASMFAGVTGMDKATAHKHVNDFKSKGLTTLQAMIETFFESVSEPASREHSHDDDEPRPFVALDALGAAPPVPLSPVREHNPRVAVDVSDHGEARGPISDANGGCAPLSATSARSSVGEGSTPSSVPSYDSAPPVAEHADLVATLSELRSTWPRAASCSEAAASLPTPQRRSLLSKLTGSGKNK